MTKHEAADILAEMSTNRCEHIGVSQCMAIDKAICSLTADKIPCPKGHDVAQPCYEFCAFREGKRCTLHDYGGE